MTTISKDADLITLINVFTLTIAKFEPGIYDVVDSFAPPPDPV